MLDLSKAGYEPDLSDLLNDPVLHLVMQRDGLNPDALHQAIDCASARIAELKKAA